MALNVCKSWNIYRPSIFTLPLSFKIMQNEKQAEELGVTAEVTGIASWALFVMGRPEAAGLLKESVFAAGLLPHHYQCVQ